LEFSQGSGGSGTTLTPTRLFIRHNGLNSITNCKLYIGEKSGSYTGAATAAADKAELLGWGDKNTSNSFGGIQLNFDQVNNFPAGEWGTFDSKDKTYGRTIRTAMGDKKENGIIIPTQAGCPFAGVIPAGNTPGVSFQLRVKIPTDEGTTGKREFDLKLRYTYTS
jgi:hypothetical protein